MRGPSPLLALALALLARPAAAVGDGSPYPLTSLLLVRVGDGFGSTLTARAAPVYLDEVYPAFAASQGRVSSQERMQLLLGLYNLDSLPGRESQSERQRRRGRLRP